ncbi:MAG: hypothetical protein JW966_16690 [Anaerolineae bacterium]|nr:hypothetical protein [Anaerolineae bacterium]
MGNEQSTIHYSMSKALDHELSESELESLNAHLSESEDDARHFERMRKTDQLLHETPMINAPSGFAQRVMQAIAVMNLADFANQRLSVGVALGLVAAALLTIPILSMLLIALVTIFTDPGTLQVILQAAINASTSAIGLIADLADGVQNMISDMPMIPALLTTVIPLSMLWGWLIWYLLRDSLSQNRDIH